jgi:DUF1680 family protein
MPVHLRWPRRRASYISSFCCPPNVLRTIAGAGSMAYGLTERGVLVNLYGGSRLDTKLRDGSSLVLAQESAYPWDGEVRLTVERTPAKEMSISLRIPAWADGARAILNGAPLAAACLPGCYYEVRRAWTAGDVLSLSLPMEPRLLLAHPLVEESRNQAAVMRGPVVYCLESDDLPAGVGLKDVLLDSGAQFVARPGEGVMKRMVVLSGRATRLSLAAETAGAVDSARAATPAEGIGLYSPLTSWKLEAIPLTLVPYFAWDNRGAGEMSVWLPLRWT